MVIYYGYRYIWNLNAFNLYSTVGKCVQYTKVCLHKYRIIYILFIFLWFGLQYMYHHFWPPPPLSKGTSFMDEPIHQNLQVKISFEIFRNWLITVVYKWKIIKFTERSALKCSSKLVLKFQKLIDYSCL